ncbi:hypothetical protein GGR26_002408 [Lewinella marina]|uniref:Outer membrane protein beta-barrel domain-containing protein n=1 Tax=Neolewinella marina TaxID=438751 RepID=A0A2G0CBX0_9BACT|nr:hypothetical protein [Neolewinella marina]NJB86631.1 hypothetical protein [Neolewinella marina]PHK97440.1 hypothetical protein CGL56_15180 [Neolewinella marina]
MRASFLLLLSLFLLSDFAHAQTREDQARDDLSYGGNARRVQENQGGDIWYGAGATIGFQANSYSSSFRIGVAPMAGYKVNNFLSVGPRVSLIYNAFRYDGGFNGSDFRDKSLTWAAGLFTRAKIYRGFFAHAEYSLLSEKEFYQDPGTGNIADRRITRAIPFLGAGLSQGGGVGSTGFEILILFRVSQRERLNDAPYEIRSGINYNF